MTTEITKEHMMKMEVGDFELLMRIIGDLTFPGFKICICKLRGQSYMQCAIRYGLDRETTRRMWAKCVEKQHDIALKKIFGI